MEKKVDSLTVWEGEQGVCRLHYTRIADMLADDILELLSVTLPVGQYCCAAHALNREGGVVAARVAHGHSEYAQVSGLVFNTFVETLHEWYVIFIV